MNTTSPARPPHFDAIVIGAGFGGLYMLHKLRNELGLSVRAFERGGGVGGTWYWNRYPGALSDTEGFVYRYSFDKRLLQESELRTRYLKQADILAYLEHVAERYDLNRDIQLNTRIRRAHYDERANLWEVATAAGETFTARYVVSSLGLLSTTHSPDIKNRARFKGDILHTGAWPDGYDLRGKRVGVIGTGSTGVQFIIAAAPVVKHLTVLQRSPQYVVPAGNRPVPGEVAEALKAHYDRIWEGVRDSVVAFGFKESTVSAMSVSEAERQRIFQEVWDIGGGFRFMFATFCDIATDPDANEAAAAFIRAKIAEIVKDPETARKLTPTGFYAKRPLCGNNYFETYNRENVALVDVKANPIVEMTEKGIVTADGVEHGLDALVCATGFDAVDGNYKQMDIRGRDGLTIQSHWKDAPTSYLGVATAGFPNFFMVLGPNGPFTNLPPSIETQVEWISALIGHAETSGIEVIEATSDAETAWTETCKSIAGMTLFPKVDSWIFGANIPGKTNTVMFYLGGLKNYRAVLDDVVANGFRGFELHRARTAA